MSEKITFEDYMRCFNDSVFFRSLRQQSWHGYIKTLYLKSAERLPAGSTERWHIAPLGLSFKVPMSELIESPSVESEKHKLDSRTNENSNKQNVTATLEMKSANLICLAV